MPVSREIQRKIWRERRLARIAQRAETLGIVAPAARADKHVLRTKDNAFVFDRWIERFDRGCLDDDAASGLWAAVDVSIRDGL